MEARLEIFETWSSFFGFASKNYIPLPRIKKSLKEVSRLIFPKSMLFIYDIIFYLRDLFCIIFFQKNYKILEKLQNSATKKSEIHQVYIWLELEKLLHDSIWSVSFAWFCRSFEWRETHFCNTLRRLYCTTDLFALRTTTITLFSSKLFTNSLLLWRKFYKLLTYKCQRIYNIIENSQTCTQYKLFHIVS